MRTNTEMKRLFKQGLSVSIMLVALVVMEVEAQKVAVPAKDYNKCLSQKVTVGSEGAIVMSILQEVYLQTVDHGCPVKFVFNIEDVFNERAEVNFKYQTVSVVEMVHTVLKGTSLAHELVDGGNNIIEIHVKE